MATVAQGYESMLVVPDSLLNEHGLPVPPINDKSKASGNEFKDFVHDADSLHNDAELPLTFGSFRIMKM